MTASRKAQGEPDWADAAYEMFIHGEYMRSALDLRIEDPARDLPDVQLDALCELIVAEWNRPTKAPA